MILKDVVINDLAFTFICIFAGIGFLICVLIVLYIVAGIIDLTYQQRHKERKVDCPEKIEKEDNDK